MFPKFLRPCLPQVGDQILKVCGMPVLQSTHREVVTVIQGRARLQLKVGHGLYLTRRNSPFQELIFSFLVIIGEGFKKKRPLPPPAPTVTQVRF